MLDAKSSPAAEAPGLARQVEGRVGAVYEHAFHGFQFLGSGAAAAALSRDPHVVSVTADRVVTLTETAPFGISRIGAFKVGGGDAYAAGFRGSGARIAIIDSGIDLDHPDLVGNIDTATGMNCVNPALPPNDGQGHGTHVAGIAAAPLNDIGVVGVAPEAQLIPIKSFDDSGNSTEAFVICGLDHVVALNTDGDPANDVDVVNMSWGTTDSSGSCVDDPLHASICAADAAGAVLVGGVGNSATDAGPFVPAAFPEVIGVSAIADFDGKPGGLAGCQFIVTLLANQCDDAFAVFSNFGPSVDVTAPGVNVYSTWPGGGYRAESGTSMATPHVAGVAALMRAADPTLTTAAARTMLQETGEGPDGKAIGAGCVSTVQWPGDRDGIGEPLVNALRAAQRASDPTSGDPPAITLSPAEGSTVGGVVALTATASHASGIASVEFFADGASLGVDSTDPYSASWDATLTPDGAHTIRAMATAVNGARSCTTSSVSVGVNHQGSWVGTYGADGYILATWDRTAGTDLSILPAGVSYTLEQGTRTGTSWPQPTTDVRGLQSPSGSERRAGAWYHATEVRARLTFTAAYTGALHVYAVDWGTTTRRQKITVDDGSGPRTAALTTSFNGGAWLHFPVTVPAGGSIVVKVNNTAGTSSTGVVSGLFLGGAGTPPQP
jgi:subtilisin family serine protease